MLAAIFSFLYGYCDVENWDENEQDSYFIVSVLTVLFYPLMIPIIFVFYITYLSCTYIVKLGKKVAQSNEDSLHR